MKIKDLKIGLQLRLGFGIILFLIIVSGVMTWFQNDKLAGQTTEMYEHPLKVQRTLGTLQSDVLIIQRDMRNLFLSLNNEELTSVLQEIESKKADGLQRIDTLFKLYLGPISDIDSVYNNFIVWNTRIDETIRLIQTGKSEQALDNLKPVSGFVAVQAEKILSQLQYINNFAKNKADQFYAEAMKSKKRLNITTVIFIFMSIFIAFFIIFILLENIKKPLVELRLVTRKLMEGKTDARIKYSSKNIFGDLSAGFNSMADTIESEFKLKNHTAEIAEVMLSEEDARKFCKKLLQSLLKHTESQIGAVYFLNEEKTSFDHFESIGGNEDIAQSFSAVHFEGEFGQVLASKKMQYLTNISDKSRFSFSTVNGQLAPCEIITVPILSGKKVIAILSLSSIKKYTSESIKLVKSIIPMLNARMSGVLAHHKTVLFSKELEEKNIELDAQKKELSAQTYELMEQNTELELQKKQLDEASRLKTNFLSNMSHELRTPLNSVIALSGVLNRRLNKKIPEEEYSYLEVIERNGKHLLSLINDILDISRIESGKEEIEISEFNVNDLISEIVSMVKPQADLSNIELVHVDNKAKISIRSDFGKCRQILQNIISNAVKFTEKGTVEVKASQHEKYVDIVVKDTGIGIDKKHISHIFDEFRQADSSTSRRFGGTGLGLAIAKKLSHLLGGKIEVESVPGEGSTFTLTLPLSCQTDNRDTKIGIHVQNNISVRQKIQDAPNYADGKTILLVEDSEPAIIQIKDIFDHEGYRVLAARNGVEALEIISHTVPDAMILDLMMPGMDGFEVLKLIRENERTLNIPILILTAKHITKEELSFLKKNNIYQLIQKGDVNRNDLMNAVASMVFTEEDKAPKTIMPVPFIEGKPLVLIVEDNQDNMLTIKALLGDEFTILEATNGNEGVDIAKQYIPHLILMDIALPEKDGIDAFYEIRKIGNLEHVPIIALTASAMNTDRETILAHGFDDYIAKPIDDKLFFKTINQILYGK